MAEWLKATDCKSVLSRVRRFETYSAHKTKFANMPIGKCASLNVKVLCFCTFANFTSGSSSFGRAVAFQASGGRFEPGLPLFVVGNLQSAVANCKLLFAN